MINIICVFQTKDLLLPKRLVSPVRSGKRIKRESGGNPEQSRCCEASKSSGKGSLPLMQKTHWEGSGREVSQKTCQHYMLSVCEDNAVNWF